MRVPSPRLRDYMWHPRFAKIWWALSFVHWAGMVVSLGIEPLNAYYGATFAGWLGVLLYPPFMLAVCGVRLLWAKIECGKWVVEPLDWDHFPHRREVHDPYTDPLDPRSGPLYLHHIGALKD